MRIDIEDYKTGWYGVSVRVNLEEIDSIISLLKQIKKDPMQHFHISSTFEGHRGISDIGFYLAGDDLEDNCQLSWNESQ